ncbi:toxin-antitoxin system YwqK family antitoxin [Tenacibaculum sp.]|uniref:toxin-antitoxin system YwqK family antitoxin n=1 Tax=Tenacibaculum sp. TaxID=1906242 RepID=UPI003D0F53BA
MKNSIVFLVISCIFFSFLSDVQKRTIRDDGFDIECYIALKKLKSFGMDKTYYWFKSGRIHHSLSNIGGYVLHDSYIKYYRSNQLAEKGVFNYGLKTGIWENWYENGQLKLQEVWSNGYRDGEMTSYDEDGNLVLKGEYRNNLKVGYWIDYKTKDTLYYKKDIKFEEKPKNLLQRVLRKKDSIEKVQIKAERINERKKDSLKRVKRKVDRLIKKRNDSINKAQEKMEKLNQKKLDSIEKSRNTHESFFDKLFKKKDKKQKEPVKTKKHVERA